MYFVQHGYKLSHKRRKRSLFAAFVYTFLENAPHIYPIYDFNVTTVTPASPSPYAPIR